MLEVSSSRFLGVMIFIWGLGLTPVAFKYMKHFQVYKRLNMVIIILGAIIGLLSPAYGTLSASADGDEDLHLYQAPWWIGWTGTLAAALLICHLFNVIPLPHTTPVRYTMWSAITTISAITFSRTFLPYAAFHVTICICVIFSLGVLTIDLSHFPKTSNDYKPALVIYMAMQAVCIVAYVSIQNADFREVTHVYYIVLELQHISSVAIMSLIACANILISIIIKCKLVGMPLIRSKYTNSGKDTNFLYVPPKTVLPLGLIVNISCLTGFLCMAMLNILVNESNVFVFVLLSSLLLVLHQDEYLFNNFNPDKQRYVPPLVNIETLLGMIAAVELYSSLSMARMFRNLLMLLLLVPSHVVVWNFLNTFKTPRFSHSFLASIIGLIALLGTTMPPIRWLALTGVAGIGCIFFAVTLWSKQRETIL